MVILVDISWCRKKPNGIKLVAPNDNLSEEYIQTAKETLDTLKSIKNNSKIWLATTKYYAEYFAAYSLLMKIGIKSEIHECTIKVCELLEQEKMFPKRYSKILDDDKKLRIDNQYYLKNREVKISYTEILDFILNIKDLKEKLTLEQIENIRRKVNRA